MNSTKQYKFTITVEAQVNENKNFPEHVHAEQLIQSIFQSAISHKASLLRRALVANDEEFAMSLQQSIMMIESVLDSLTKE